MDTHTQLPPGLICHTAFQPPDPNPRSQGLPLIRIHCQGTLGDLCVWERDRAWRLVGVGSPNLKCRILFRYFLPSKPWPGEPQPKSLLFSWPSNSPLALPVSLPSPFFLLVPFPSLLEPQTYTNARLLELIIKETTRAHIYTAAQTHAFLLRCHSSRDLWYYALNLCVSRSFSPLGVHSDGSDVTLRRFLLKVNV